MTFLGEKSVAPTAQAHLRANVEEEEKSSQPDDAQFESSHQNIALSLRYVLLRRDFSFIEKQSKADQQHETHAHPHQIDTVPSPPDCQNCGSHHRTQPCS